MKTIAFQNRTATIALVAAAILSLPMHAVAQSVGASEVAHREIVANHLHLAIEYFEAGQVKTAAEEARKVLDLDSKNSVAWALIAAIHQHEKDIPAAEVAYKKAIDADSNNANARNNFGLLLCQRNSFDPALEQFGRALATPNYANVAQTLTNAGICLVQKGDMQAAEKYFQKADEENPSFMPAKLQLAKLYLATNRASKAAILIEHIHKHATPSSATLYLQLQIETSLGNSQQAQVVAERLARMFPDSPEARKAIPKPY